MILEQPINHSVLVGTHPQGDITREHAIELLEPVIRRIRMLPDFGSHFLVGITLRNPDAQTDPDYFLQVAEMETSYRIESFARPKQSLYRGL